MHVIFLDNGRTRDPGRRLPRDPALHPLRRLPQRLPGLPPGERPRLPRRLLRPGRRRADAAAGGRRIPRARRPAARLQPLRRLQRGLSGRHPDSRSAAAPARSRQARRRPSGRRGAVDEVVRAPRVAAGVVAARALRPGSCSGLFPGPLRPRALRVWDENHVLPPWRGGAFRTWMAERKRQAAQPLKPERTIVSDARRVIFDRVKAALAWRRRQAAAPRVPGRRRAHARRARARRSRRDASANGWSRSAAAPSPTPAALGAWLKEQGAHPRLLRSRARAAGSVRARRRG